MGSSPSRRIVLGIGNPDRGDDAAGRAVTVLLRQRSPTAVELAVEDGEATKLLAALDGAAAAWLIDASASGATPGTVRRFDVAASPLPQIMAAASTHGISLAAVLELARALGRLPRFCVVYAIEGQCFDLGAPLSPPVRAAVADVANRLIDEMTTR